jgi:hypothetical protein
MCKAVGVARKTAHCLRVTCASSLFNAGIDTKLIRDRTGHRSDALHKYEKADENLVSKVSAILGPKCTQPSMTKCEEKAKEMPATELTRFLFIWEILLIVL